MDLPQNLDLAVCSSPITQEHVSSVMRRLQGALPGSRIKDAEPSKLPGLVELTLSNGTRLYTDCRGQYIIMGLMFDLNSPREQLSGRSN